MSKRPIRPKMQSPSSFNQQESQVRRRRAHYILGAMSITALSYSNISKTYAETDLEGKYKPCVDYYTLGVSNCRDEKAAPKRQPAPLQLPLAQQAPKQPDEVQQYLDNYGKPPREFVEFYLNPTSENAARWVSKFNEINKKTKQVSQAWNEAESRKINEKQMVASKIVATKPVVVPKAPIAAAQQNTSTNTMRFGAFAESPQFRTKLTYYFSASCPFCARLHPLLSDITNKNREKLVFTCVDITPLSPAKSPNPANRQGLPCDWRVANATEIEDNQIRQTPTMIITRPNQPPIRVSGLVDAIQLKSYLGL
jgi:hypothetical protein